MNKNLLKYIIPSMVASLFVGAYAIIDGAFIGSKLGDIGLSAVNIAWPITAFVQTIGLAIGIGGGIRLSLAEGEKNEEKYNKILNSTILIMIYASIFFTIFLPLLAKPLLKLSGAKGVTLEYGLRYLLVMAFGSIFQVFSGGLVPILKNKGQAKFSMCLSIVACLTNCLLDYLLIFVIDTDLLGAALASIIGQAIIAVFSYFKIKPKVNFKNICYKEVLLASIAPFVLNYSYAIITIINNSFCLAYSGESGVAAYTIYSYLIYIVGASASGTGDGVQPLISYYCGQGDKKEMKKTFYLSSIIGIFFSSLIILIIILLKNIIPNIYNLSDSSLNYYNFAFYFYISAYFILVFNRLIGCFMYSSNNYRLSNFLTLLEPLLITPIILGIMAHYLNMNGILCSYLVIQLILFFISLALLFYVLRRMDFEPNKEIIS